MGREAANVTGPNREPVRRSSHASHRRRLRSRQFFGAIQHLSFFKPRRSLSLRNAIQELEPQFWQSKTHQRWISSECRGQCELGKYHEVQKRHKSSRRLKDRGFFRRHLPGSQDRCSYDNNESRDSEDSGSWRRSARRPKPKPSFM